MLLLVLLLLLLLLEWFGLLLLEEFSAVLDLELLIVPAEEEAVDEFGVPALVALLPPPFAFVAVADGAGAGLFFLRTFFVFGSLLSFFHFILRFWNHIFICLSERQSEWAISIRLRRVRYRLKWNSFSSSRI